MAARHYTKVPKVYLPVGHQGSLLSVLLNIVYNLLQLHCPADALASISHHLAGLSFEDTPDYDYLRKCLQQLPDAKVQLHNLALPGVQQQQQVPNGQQYGDVPAAGQLEPSLQQQEEGWPDWADAAAADGQQQQQLLLTPESPSHEQSTADFTNALTAAGKFDRAMLGGTWANAACAPLSSMPRMGITLLAAH